MEVCGLLSGHKTQKQVGIFTKNKAQTENSQQPFTGLCLLPVWLTETARIDQPINKSSLSLCQSCGDHSTGQSASVESWGGKLPGDVSEGEDINMWSRNSHLSPSISTSTHLKKDMISLCLMKSEIENFWDSTPEIATVQYLFFNLTNP